MVKLFYKIYHLVFSSPVAACRFNPTCSQYALEACEKYGFLKGSWLAIRRILSCHPFSRRPLYDPI